MNDSKRNTVERLQAFFDAYLDGLQDANEDDLLGTPQGRTADRARFATIVQKAKLAARKQRLEDARRALDHHAAVDSAEVPVDLVEARRFIAQAVNDKRFTLAARDFTDMSNEDVVRIYRQLIELGNVPIPKKS
jgi:hypothetical protein